MKRWLALGLVGFVLVPAATLVLVLVAAAGAVASTCTTSSAGGSARQVAGQDLDTEQLANAQTIVSVVRNDSLPPYAAVVALATAMQESSLRNDLRQLDHDSIGLFQQRVSIYGADTAGDPVKSTQAFLRKLIALGDWQRLPLTEAAAQVQIPRSDLRGEYAKWQPLAEALVTQLWPGAVVTGGGCTGGTTGAQADGGGLPAGFQLPTDTQQRTVIAFALAQLGKPYVFGAAGPDAFDCSGLMVAAWATVGVALPRSTFQQVHIGIAVSLTTMQPGDLIFTPGSDGTPSNPGHVGMYIGTDPAGAPLLVQAPKTGDVVKITPVSSWASQIVSIRRPMV